MSWHWTFTSEAFWARVDRSDLDGCWPWTGKPDRYGYCHVRNGRGKQPRAHRVAYEIAYGVAPGELYVCHRCDNRRCCRPSHLFLGTAQDNILDMHAKGRGVVPEPRRGRQCLTPEQEADIRSALRAGVTQAALARVYGVSRPTVRTVGV